MPYAAFVGDFINRVLISQNFRTKARSFFYNKSSDDQKRLHLVTKPGGNGSLNSHDLLQSHSRDLCKTDQQLRVTSTEVKIPIYRTEKAVYNNKLHTILMSLIEPCRRITGIYSTQSTVNMCL